MGNNYKIYIYVWDLFFNVYYNMLYVLIFIKVIVVLYKEFFIC